MSSATEELRERRVAHVPRGVGTTHPIFVESAHGVRVRDVDGHEYFDFVGGIGVLNVGHTHPKIVDAVQRQVERLTHTCFQVAMYESYVALAERLNRLAPGATPKKTLLLTTGAEATENAVKIAREYTRRSGVVAFTNGYHGRTLLALSMTGKNAPYKQHFGPYCGEVYHAPYPDEFRGWTSERALDALHELFATQVPADTIAAIIIEPVLGEGGFVPAPVEFLRALRSLADLHGIVLIADEIQTGFGRTGTYFAIEHSGIEADLITIAKSVAGGLPISAVIGKAEIMDSPSPGGLGGTFAGNPIACAAALATLDVFQEERLLEKSRTIANTIRDHLDALARQFSQIVDVRGVGAMIGVEFAAAPDGSSLAARVVEQARMNGLLLLTAGRGHVIRFLVPLVIEPADLQEALGRFTRSLEIALTARGN
ncbi:MAG: 4-aminobutyrate--2-oxoglutarate transaminase [Candidatus Eremiobacteraeota bacterium]|nr:4-aminobutyrate--2-oxoglutarate transaminase [Candidatus Eremiobacteraeota bacterium]